MEPITICGAIILVLGIRLEFEGMLNLLRRASFSSKIESGVVRSSLGKRPIYVKYFDSAG